MKTTILSSKPDQAASALVLTMIMSGVALAILAGAMMWSASSTRLTHRSIQYNRSVSAAEAATEKVLSHITQDFLYGGEKLVSDNLDVYRQKTVPTSADSSFWNNWEFSDAKGNAGQTYIELGESSKYVVLNSTYSGLRGFVTTYDIVSHARDKAALQNVVAGVFQEVKLASIPIFQFAMYSSGDMEISCGQPLDITGRVHSNGELYVEPDAKFLTFESDVTAVGDILFQRHPLDTRGDPAGGAIYVFPDQKIPHVPAMTLPIGTTNTPEAIREIIQPPPVGEDANSPIGRLRYYNQADVIIEVFDNGITAKSGKINNFLTVFTNSEVTPFVATNNSFWDAREEKTVRPVDIDIGALKTWSETSAKLSAALGGTNVLSAIYVWDHRNLSGAELSAVRVLNGKQLPKSGLTVSTARPLYVLGHYNQTSDANLGTTNTSTTRPASLAADAITILSANWLDRNAVKGASPAGAASTTVNAAFLTGVVETTKGQYSGGMENFPRFLESWGLANVFTYNGSMVKMFPSLYATGVWGKANVYSPPKRNWAYDINFEDATKLPPRTPRLQKVIRGQWATVAPDKNTVP